MALAQKKTPKKIKRKLGSNGKGLIKVTDAEGLIALDTAEVTEMLIKLKDMELTKAGEQIANIAATLKPLMDDEQQKLQDTAARVKAGGNIMSHFETMLCTKQRKEGITEAVYASTDRVHKLTVKATTSKLPSLLIDKDKINNSLLGAEELVELFEMLREDDPNTDVLEHVKNAFLMLTRGKRAFVKAKVEIVAKAVTDVLKEREEAEKEGIPAIDAELPERLEGHVSLKRNLKNEMVLGEDVNIRK